MSEIEELIKFSEDCGGMHELIASNEHMLKSVREVKADAALKHRRIATLLRAQQAKPVVTDAMVCRGIEGWHDFEKGVLGDGEAANWPIGARIRRCLTAALSTGE
jgi:hypothetical protein